MLFQRDAGLVQLQRADEQDVPRQKMVVPALDGIIDVPVLKQVYFIEIMMMQRHVIQIGIPVTVDLVVIGEHLLAHGEFLDLISQHSPCLSSA